jgi:hypothetical protein
MNYHMVLTKVSLVEQELLPFQTTWVYPRFLVAFVLLDFMCMFCRSLFVLLFIVLFVLLQFWSQVKNRTWVSTFFLASDGETLVFLQHVPVINIVWTKYNDPRLYGNGKTYIITKLDIVKATGNTNTNVSPSEAFDETNRICN